MSQKVNLDALIPREDFEIDEKESNAPGRQKDSFVANDLQRGEFFLSYLRKPDFQRETSEWDAQKICNIIESFLNSDLIPAVILWRNKGTLTFVIDGAHRISALAAWVNNDYGDGPISKEFFDYRIPEEQMEHAKKTRDLVDGKIGPFSDFKLANTNPSKVRPDIALRARNLGSLAIQLQWVSGDAKKAEDSFFTINQQASPINKTELSILKARKQSYGIATRAIFRAGQGHKYWSDFESNTQEKVQEISKSVHDLLFTPRLKTPIKTLDIPVGGKLSSANALALVLDFVCIANEVKTSEKNKGETQVANTKNLGDQTINLLNRCQEVARRINSLCPGSLGLHPAVYFYSGEGVHKVASFYAVIAMIIEFEKNSLWNSFIDVRGKFENFLIKYGDLVQQIVRKHRGALASHEHIRDFFLRIITEMKEKELKDAIDTVRRESRFAYLKDFNIDNEYSGSDFTEEAKSKVFLNSALSNAQKCGICGGYLHTNSITVDHIKRKRDGGEGVPENGQLAHPYCNTTYKN